MPKQEPGTKLVLKEPGKHVLPNMSEEHEQNSKGASGLNSCLRGSSIRDPRSQNGTSGVRESASADHRMMTVGFFGKALITSFNNSFNTFLTSSPNSLDRFHGTAR